MQLSLPGAYSVRSLASRASRGVWNPVAGRVTARRDYDLSNTIFVAGWARSGTTWLAEVLSAIPKSAILFEPLHTERVPAAAAAGFPSPHMLAPGEGTASQKQFMERVLQGRVLNWWTCSCNPVGRAISPSLWIVKEIQANYLLEWIVGTFPIRRSILIVRHPCATIGSRLAQGWAPGATRSTIKQGAARGRYPHLDALCEGLTDPFEVMAARWCIMNYVPMRLRPRPFHVVSYEALATQGAEALEPAFKDWGLEMPPAIEASLGRASSTTKAASSGGPVHRQSIDGWKRKLTPDQIRRVLAVVKRFGMDFYTDDLEPDYRRLNQPLEH
jgi:hypothetical protein